MLCPRDLEPRGYQLPGAAILPSSIYIQYGAMRYTGSTVLLERVTASLSLVSIFRILSSGVHNRATKLTLDVHYGFDRAVCVQSYVKIYHSNFCWATLLLRYSGKEQGELFWERKRE